MQLAQNSPNLSILIVDDYPDAANMLAMLLQSDGYRAVGAHNASEAAQRLGDFVPDVLILDIAMPGMDGYDLAAHLCNAIGRKPLLIGLSGFDKLEKRSQREGFDHHFLKPIDNTALLAILADYAQSLAAKTC